MKNFGDLRSAVQRRDLLEIARILSRNKDPRLEEYVISSLGYLPPTQLVSVNEKPYNLLSRRERVCFCAVNRHGDKGDFWTEHEDVDHFYELYVERLFEEAFGEIVELSAKVKFHADELKQRALKQEPITETHDLKMAMSRIKWSRKVSDLTGYAYIAMVGLRHQNTMAIVQTLISVLNRKRTCGEIGARSAQTEKRHFEQRVMHHRVMLELGAKR